MATARAERHSTRPFAAGAFAFVVETDDPQHRAVVEALFADLPVPDLSEPSPAVFSLRSSERGGGWSLGGPRLGERTPTTFDAALKWLLTAVNLCALDAEPEHLHLHAAAAIRDDRAVVIAAERDVGKTTTVAHLVARGWSFVTDETVRLSAGTDEITGIPKPLSIKPGGSELLPDFQAWTIPADGGDPDGFRFVPIGTTGAPMTHGGHPHLVVLLRRPFVDTVAPGATPRQIHPADAVVALMQETLDAERFGRAAEQLAALAATSHCVELTMGTPDETADAIESLFRLDPAEPVAVSVLPTSDAFSPGVVSVAVGDRTVVHDTASGRIFALDAGGAQVWARLGGWTVDGTIDVDGPVIRPFVARLRALGVLAGAA